MIIEKKDNNFPDDNFPDDLSDKDFDDFIKDSNSELNDRDLLSAQNILRLGLQKHNIQAVGTTARVQD
jgi:hypothetical protein